MVASERGRVAGKVAVVTGAGSGIGAASAASLAGEGAVVVLADIDGDRAEAHAAALRAEGYAATAMVVNVADDTSVHAMIDDVVARHGGLDVLHNNALGMTGDFDGRARSNDLVHEADPLWYDALLHATVTTTMTATKHALPHLLARGGGSIINTASVAGTRGSEYHAAYGAGKAGVIQLTRSVAAMYGAEGIRCNAVCPGLTLTPAAEGAFPEEARAAFLRQTPSRRLGRPDDIAHLVVYLASDESEMMNGQALVVDGGFSMHDPMWADRRA